MLGVHWEGLRLSLYVFCCRLIKVSFLCRFCLLESVLFVLASSAFYLSLSVYRGLCLPPFPPLLID